MIKSNKLLLIILIFAILLGTSTTFASFIDETYMELHANEFGFADVKMTNAYKTITTDDVSFVIYGKVSDVFAKDENGELNCTANEKAYGTQIICKRKENVKENYTVNLEYRLKNIIFENKKINKTIDKFLFEYSIVEPIDKLHILFIMPEGWGILDEKQVQPYYPFSGKVVVIDNRKFAIEWKLENLTIGKSHFFKINYEKVAKQNNNTIPNNNKPIDDRNLNKQENYTIIILALIGIIFYLVMKIKTNVNQKETIVKSNPNETQKQELKPEEKEVEKKQIEDVMLLTILKPDERKVFDLICASGGIGKQRQIARTTRFSPAKVSHIIKSLSARGLIEIQRQGRSTRIELTKKAKEFIKEDL